MKRTSATRCLGVLLVASVAFMPSGCSREHWYHIRGTVRDSGTGEPVVGVKVEMRTVGGDSVADPLVTDERGEFAQMFEADHLTMYWRLVLKATGYEEEWIKVGDIEAPQDMKEPAYLIFHVTMRRIAP